MLNHTLGIAGSFFADVSFSGIAMVVARDISKSYSIVFSSLKMIPNVLLH